MAPTDHISTPVEYCRPPSRISGDRYHRVTTTWMLIQHCNWLLNSLHVYMFSKELQMLLQDRNQPIWGYHLDRSTNFVVSNLDVKFDDCDNIWHLQPFVPWISLPCLYPIQVSAYLVNLLEEPCLDLHLRQGELPYISWDPDQGIRRPGRVCDHQHVQYSRVARYSGRSFLWGGRSLELLYLEHLHLQPPVESSSMLQSFHHFVDHEPCKQHHKCLYIVRWQ